MRRQVDYTRISLKELTHILLFLHCVLRELASMHSLN